MRRLKKGTALGLVVALSLSLCSCGKEAKLKVNTTEKITVATTTEDDILVDTTEDTSVVIDEEAAKKEQAKFDDWCMEEFKEGVNEDSISLNYALANPEAYGIEPVKATWGDAEVSLAKEEEYRKENQEFLDELEAFDYDLLTDTQKYTYDVLKDRVELGLQDEDFYYYSEPFAYTSGLQMNIPITLAEYNFYDRQDIDDYIELLKQCGDYYAGRLAFEKEKSKAGFFMSEESANEVIRQCKEFIANPEENLLIATFDSRVDAFEGLTDEERAEYKKANHDAVINNVVPAYKSIITVFEALKKTGKNSGGLCNFEKGKEYYAWRLKIKTGSDKTPEEVIDLLENELHDTLTEMVDLYTNNREEIDEKESGAKETYEKFEDYVDVVNRVHEAAKDRFPAMPDVEFTTTPVHKSLEDSTSPAFYMTPAIDSYTKNSIFINEKSVNNDGIWNTLAHEGVPGHMYQYTYYLNTKPTPIRTQMSFSGYTEGWATYAENMSFDMYDKYPAESYGKMERINNILGLIVSARCEIGVNYEGWDLEGVRTYLKKSGLNEKAAENLFNYVVKEPINYQMYVLGYLEFKELREHAESELGDKFDEVAFHKVLLDAGPSQFYLLRRLVDKYIEENK